MRKLFQYLVIFLIPGLGYSCKKDHTNSPDPNNPDPILNISRTNIEVGNDIGYTDTVVIQSNVDWTITVSDTWLSVDPVTKGANDTTIVTIKVKTANTSPTQTATLTITPAGAGLQPKQVNITRKTYSLVWQKCYGGSDNDQCYATAVFPNGQFVATGMSNSTDGDAAGNTGGLSNWTLRANSDGSKLWQNRVAPLDVEFHSITPSPNGGTVCLANRSVAGSVDIFVTKLDAAGNVNWSKQYGGTNNENSLAIISTPDGGYLVSGDSKSKDGDFVNNQGGSDLYVLKLDADGNKVWLKTFGGVNQDLYATAAVCSDGGYVVVGHTTSNNSGDVGANHGSADLLIVKTDANGNKLWSKTIGGSGLDGFAHVISDADGGCVIMSQTTSIDGDVAGRSGKDYDTWVVKLTKEGQIGWQTSLGGSGYEVVEGLVRLPNGNIAVLNTSNSTDRGVTGNRGSDDAWIVVLNPVGKKLWQRAFGSSTADYPNCINAGADGSILVTSVVTGNDGDVSGNHGYIDTWIFKLQ